MVYKVLQNGESGDLNNLWGVFGASADSIIVFDNFSYSIKTYENADTVDFRFCNYASHTHVVNLGAGDDFLYGNDARQLVKDGSGMDHVSLGGGDDAVYVGSGNDKYDGGAGAHDTLNFQYANDDGRSALVENTQGVTVDLAKTTLQYNAVFGNDQYLNFEDAIGGRGNDTFWGNDAANILNGQDGNDTLVGRGGADELWGGNGKDRLFGGAGTDKFYLGSLDNAQDSVIFSAISDSSTNAPDVVFQFEKHVGTQAKDLIDLRSIDANASLAGDQAFFWQAGNPFSTDAKGEVRIAIEGSNTMVYIDTDSDTAAEMVVRIANVTGLNATDFLF